MFALVFRDQNGWSVELFDDETTTERRFYQTRDEAGGQASDYEWKDGQWIADSDTDVCYVANSVSLPPSRRPGSDDPDDKVEMRWHNFYRCPDCGGEWDDCWDSQCDDDCPHCGCRHVSPYDSKKVEEKCER
jgi:hypothetical protein